MRKLTTLLLLVGLLSARALADAPMTMLTPKDLKWGDAPPVFAKGSKMAVLYGDPSKEGQLFIVRLKMPAGYKVAAHWHPTDENITVLSGTFLLGMGTSSTSRRPRRSPPGASRSHRRR